jgi:hypothetical protein
MVGHMESGYMVSCSCMASLPVLVLEFFLKKIMDWVVSKLKVNDALMNY